MKNILIGLIIILFVGCSSTLTKEELKVVTFDTSIHCANCVNTMFDNLPKEEGVIDLEVGLDEKTVTVVFNPSETTIEKLADKINELGYSATVKELQNQ